MIEVTGNLWTYPAGVRVITTNGTVKSNGECVMGRGCAAEAKARWPHLPRHLGRHIKAQGNRVFYFRAIDGRYDLATFPVKHHWRERADLDLIAQSVEQLVEAVNSFSTARVIVLPRPGCGNGGLRWEDVRPVVAALDDRFHVITFAAVAAAAKEGR